jgi:hypothetical protein
MLGNALCETTPEVSLGNVPNIMGKDETIPYNIKFWGGRFRITNFLKKRPKKRMKKSSTEILVTTMSV